MTFKLIFPLLFLASLLFFLPQRAIADEFDEITKKLDELSRARDMSVAATKPLESRLNTLEKQLADIKARVAAIEADLLKKKNDLEKAEGDLTEKQDAFAQKVRKAYIRSYSDVPILSLFSQEEATNVTRDLAYRQALAQRDKEAITILALWIKDLEERRAALEKENTRLIGIKAKVDEESGFLSKEVAGAKAYQAQLSSEIAQLTARQQQILAEKLGSLNLPVSLGAGPLFCTDDRKLDPGFGNAFAFFTFGIPHRVGMNQYGALGRAQAGQSHEDILRAYFADFSFEQRSNVNMSVSGYGSMSLEIYLLGIYEMPESWPLEALKAQAIAARSYALSYTDNGAKEICTTQSCQVYKQPHKSGAWKTAVEETAGKTMVSGGSPISAWYSSTDGGYTYTSADVGWSSRSFTKRLRDTTSDVAGFSDLFTRAYDRDSPCFYAAQGVRSQYAKSAWLKVSEVADIVNVILLVRRDSGTRSHLYQPDKPNPEGQANWDSEQVKTELRSRGGTPFSSISNVSISADFGTGIVTNVSVAGDGGSESFNGTEFRNFFNLRAPANIQIVGPLYNVEKR